MDHRQALAAKHQGLDQQLAAELRRPHPDSNLVAMLKKQKLRLKEMLSR